MSRRYTPSCLGASVITHQLDEVIEQKRGLVRPGMKADINVIDYGRLKLHAPEERSSQLDEQADAILDKLHRQGQESLSSRERKILEEYSRRMKEKFR